jgi:hypothetical protein
MIKVDLSGDVNGLLTADEYKELIGQ